MKKLKDRTDKIDNIYAYRFSFSKLKAILMLHKRRRTVYPSEALKDSLLIPCCVPIEYMCEYFFIMFMYGMYNRMQAISLIESCNKVTPKYELDYYLNAISSIKDVDDEITLYKK